MFPLTLTRPEGLKKSGWVFSLSFRRKPESSIFDALRTAWTPVFTGVTTKKQIFHTFPSEGVNVAEDFYATFRLTLSDRVILIRPIKM